MSLAGGTTVPGCSIRVALDDGPLHDDAALANDDGVSILHDRSMDPAGDRHPISLLTSLSGSTCSRCDAVRLL
jgi:hypothetical protein